MSNSSDHPIQAVGKLAATGAMLTVAGMATSYPVVMGLCTSAAATCALEGMGILWGNLKRTLSSNSPLCQAAERAIRRAEKGLRKEYRSSGVRSDLQAFELVKSCADTVAQAQFVSGPVNGAEALATLRRSLGNILHGHHEQEVEFLQKHLPVAVAEAFLEELYSSPEAWRQYHGWLMEELNANLLTLTQTVTAMEATLHGLKDQEGSLKLLMERTEQMEEVLRRLEQGHRTEGDNDAASKAGVVFNNRGVQASTINQAANNVLNGSAFSQGGNATVVNGSLPKPKGES